MNGEEIALIDQTRIDRPVLAFAAALGMLSAILFGTLPAWQASASDVNRQLREESGTTTGTRQRRRLGAALIVAETALAVVLLVGAGLLVRSLLRLQTIELGYSLDSVLTFEIGLSGKRYESPDAEDAFFNQLYARLAALPSVVSAGGFGNLRAGPGGGQPR